MKSRFDLLSKPSESKTEEIIAALWFIAALLARIAGIQWLSILFFIKSMITSLRPMPIDQRTSLIPLKTRKLGWRKLR
jgi:hypothetical protein